MKSKTKLKVKIRKKENEEKKSVIRDMMKSGQFWLGVAELLAKPRKQQVEVSLGKLDKSTKEGEVVVVPGKVLSSGELNHKLTLAAFSLSDKVREKARGAKLMELKEMIRTHKDGKGVKVVA